MSRKFFLKNTTKLLSCHFKPSGNLSLHYFCTAFVAAADAAAVAVAAIVHNELWPKTGHLFQKKSPMLFVSQTVSTFLND